VFRRVESAPNYSGEASGARPRGDLHDNIAQILFNASRKIATHERTSQRPNTIAFSLISLSTLPLSVYKRVRRATTTRADEPNTHT
jgi:hypothetical protein